MAGIASDIMLQQFAQVAKRFVVSAEAAVAAHGDELMDGKAAFVQDILSLRASMGELSGTYGHLQRHAPEFVAGLSDDLRTRLDSAIGAAEAASAGWHNNTGSSTLAPFAALADAADGVAQLAVREAPSAKPVKVVVAGGGPAGLATANLLREFGAEVHVVYPAGVDQARTGSVMVHRRGWDVLGRAGAAKLLEQAPSDAGGQHKMAALRALHETLDGRARELGVQVHEGRAVVGIEQVDDGVRVRVQREVGDVVDVDADWYVDATGGSSPVARSEPFVREEFQGTFGALPQRRSFIGQTATAIEGRGIGWTGPNGSFAVNDELEGTLTAYRATDDAKLRPVAAEEGAELLRGLGVDPATATGKPFSFVARQTLARSAAEGRVLIVGDGAGTVLPHTQAGVMLALTDAERAVKTIVSSRDATREAVSAAVRTYDEHTRMARMGASMSEDESFASFLRQLAEETDAAADEAVEAATREHDQGTRTMHRLFLA